MNDSTFAELEGAPNFGQVDLVCCARLSHLPQRAGQALAAILYSEMGEHYFSALGFSKRISEDWVWPVPQESPSKDSPRLQRLKEKALQLALPRQRTGQLQVLPTVEQIDWQIQREHLYAEQFEKSAPNFMVPSPSRTCHLAGSIPNSGIGGSNVRS